MLKLPRTYIFIAISSIALLIVLIIQVNWILETARIKEELFNEKANMVLSKTAESLSGDKDACMSVEVGCIGACQSDLALKLGQAEIRNIDSLLRTNMKFYKLHIDYSFELIKPGSSPINYLGGIGENVFKKRLEEAVSKNGLELKLILPDKEEFIMAEMTTMFGASLILIVVVIVLFWRTIFFLMKEKKLSEQTTDFLNNMTHEFKTPITNIALAGKMIVRDSNIGQEEKVKHYSGIILEENEKLRLQVEQVLSMTALERGEIPLQSVEVDFHQLINDSIKCMSVQIENKQGRFKLNLGAEKFVVMGDKTHLTNALCNLIDNAIKYCKEKPEVSIQTSNDDENLIVEISDNGIGIGREYHEQVFEKFFRIPTGDIHDVKGFGLGLAYVKNIFEWHGAIEMKSEKGSGTTFIITLPYV